MHSKLYTLSDLASPLAPITSTAKVSILLPGQKPNSISMPTFLFYAFKAKRLAAAGISNENNISDEAYETFRPAYFDSIRHMARHVNQDIIDGKLDTNAKMSATIQQRIASMLFCDSEDEYAEFANTPVRSINATKSKKNVTVPEYLFRRLSDYLGFEKTAMLHIQQAVAKIKEEGETRGVIVDGAFVGETSHSSWSKKLYNQLLLDMIKMSDMPQALNGKILSVKMRRDMRAEVTTQHRFLNKPSKI